MNYNDIENLMFTFMNYINESDIPITFKGSMVLKALLKESGYNEKIRQTGDIDGNWNSEEFPSIEQMVERLQSIIDKMNLPFYIDSFRNYGDKKSAGFEIKDNISNDVIFSMDIDVNRTIPETKEYKIDECTFIGNSPYQIIADKVYVVSTTKVFRRIKDLIDLYYISRIISFDKIKVLNILNKNSKTLDNFDSFLNRKDDLIHSYNLFKIFDGINKPDFELVYNSVKTFIKDILPNN